MIKMHYSKSYTKNLRDIGDILKGNNLQVLMAQNRLSRNVVPKIIKLNQKVNLE